MITQLKLVATIQVLLLGFGSVAYASPEIPGGDQALPIAIFNATIHPVSSEPIPSATILFAEGKISALGTDVEIPEGAQLIDGVGKHVFPGLFNAGGQIGLIEINSIRATDDSQEVGTLNPNVKAQVAVNPDSEVIPVTRANGVLLSLAVPQGGLLSGTSAVLQLDGWTWEDMTLHAPTGMHVQWPAIHAPKANDKSGANSQDHLKALRDVFKAAEAYQRVAAVDGPVDVRLEAMLPVVQQELPLIVHADTALQIQSAVAFAAERNLKLVIYGGYDAHHCARLLKENNVPVILSAVYRLPRRRSDPFDASYTLPERLRAAGVKFCIAGVGRFSAASLRNLPYHAATAVAYGLPKDEALKAITLYPAQILGVDQQVGSLETGKDATLILTTGNPLDTESQVERAFIQGRSVDLNSRHTRLWKKYRIKYQRLQD
ncbi:MAG: amidohydrolase family protein [Planctomycetaceae bacterium]|nr:amidohydrolase family protein [Planctomycetaceae bacterium]